MRTAYLDHDGPIALAHRGFCPPGPGGATDISLENTMTAFAAAVDLGYRYVETDVHATADGVVVAFHDETLDRVTDRQGAIAGLPWSEVARARVAGREAVPTLEQLLTTWPELRLNIDLKADRSVEPTVALVNRLGAHDRVLLTSFSDARRRRALRLACAPVATSAGQQVTAGWRLACLTGRPTLAAAALRGVDALQVPVSFRGVPVVTERTVALAHAAGVQVHVWTINETDEMHRLVDLGVDGIVTDRADRLLQVIAERR